MTGAAKPINNFNGCNKALTVESCLAIIKRGIDGIYHHVGKAYLDQYLREFADRCNARQLNDAERFTLLLRRRRANG